MYNRTLGHLTFKSPPSPSIGTKDESHLRMLRLWCELCVVVCPCFLDDRAERGPYLNTRINKDSLQSNAMASTTVDHFNQQSFSEGRPVPSRISSCHMLKEKCLSHYVKQTVMCYIVCAVC